MAYWFHRNPLKATANVNFELKMVTLAKEAINMCDELKNCRSTLLGLFSNPNNSVDSVDSKASAYLSLLDGLVGNENLRYALRFRWTDSLLGTFPTAKRDALFEQASICINLAIWLSKHAAMLAAQNKEDVEISKEVHKCLRRAAGIFLFVRNSGHLEEAAQPGSDLDPRVLDAYSDQCIAEAQEVTITRALELNHSQNLISSLASQTSSTYTQAEGRLSQLDPKKFGKWRLYLRAKAAFYLSLSYCSLGASLLSREECGEAIRALQESETLYKNTRQFCEEYAKAAGSGTVIRPAEHPLFHKLGAMIRQTLDKCLHENGFIYHQRIPEKAPVPESRSEFGIADPVPFSLPERSSLWTPTCSSAFAGIRRVTADPAESVAAAAAEGELPPVQEVDIRHSGTESKNHSNCVVQ